MKITTILVAIVIIVSGCGSAGKKMATSATEEKNVDYTFEVDKNYQAVYRHLLEQGRACTKPQFTAKMTVSGELFQDIKAADISVVLMGLFSNNHYLKIRVDAIGDKKSRIHVSNQLPRWNDLARAVKGWVVDGSTQCEVSGNTEQAK